MEACFVRFSCRIGLRLVTVVRGLHLGRGPVVELAVDRLAASEGVNGKVEVLERMAYGFRSRANYVAPRPAGLLRSPASAVGDMMTLA